MIENRVSSKREKKTIVNFVIERHEFRNFYNARSFNNNFIKNIFSFKFYLFLHHKSERMK